MNATAITFTGPLVDVTRLRRVVRQVTRAAAEGAKVDFDVTTQTWGSRPKFDVVPDGDFKCSVSTGDKIYGYVDQGTRPHNIAPKNKKVLVFGGGAYKAKTRVGVIGSRGGGSSGDPVFVGRPVRHPGTEAREFSDTIQAKWQRRYPELMQRAIDAEARR